MKTVLCHGCFDVLHAGHLAYFKAAKKFGDHLIVSVTTDRFVNKGPGRPYFSHGQRAEMVKALGIVDDVIISDSATAVQVIEQVKPNYYVKGPDYKDLTKDVTGEIYNEKAAVEKYGGNLVFTDEETFSSSTIINKFFSGFTEEQREKLDIVQSVGGYHACERALQALEGLRVLVVGEPILDIYRFVTPEGISSKSPTVSARFIREEKYEGGSEAIYKHLKDFCQVTKVISCQSGWPKKIRYISGTQRIFEVTEIYEDGWHNFGLPNVDVTVAADFGHGLFDCIDLSKAHGFIGLNVQTNSSNFGFNVYTKHKRWDYLCIDRRELSLAHNDRNSSPVDLGDLVWNKHGKPLSVTLGSNGSALWTKSGVSTSPAYSDTVVDATGAGDAYFAITTLLMATDCRPELVTFIGNVFAGLKTKIIGNKSAVSKAALLKAIKGILA